MKLWAFATSELRAWGESWDRFWFQPQHPASLGVLRIVAGGMLVYTHLVWGLRLEEFFGPDGWQDPLLVGAFQRGSTAHSFWWLVPPQWLWTVHWTCVAVLFCFMVGLWTRVTSLLSLAIVISYVHRAPLATFGLDQINGLLTLYLAIGPSGACYSIDRLLHRRRQAAAAISAGRQDWLVAERPRSSACLAARLVQVHMCIMYLAAGLAKLKGEAWWDGNAIWLGAANFEYQSGDLTWLAWHPWIGNVLTHVTVLWETTFWIFVWRPKLKPFVLLAGIMMHIGIGAFLGMWTFGLVMIFTYVAFIPPESLLGVQAWAAAWRGVATVEYVPTSRLSRWLASWRGALHIGQPPLLRRRVAADAPERAPAVPQLPGDWWRTLRQLPVGQWPFPRVELEQTSLPRDIVIMSSRVALQINLEQRFQVRGHSCRTAADVPAVCAALSAMPAQCLVVCVHHPEELEDVRALRELCLAAGNLAPVTITALDKSLFHSVDWQPTVEHRLVSPPFSCVELIEEMHTAWAHRAGGGPQPASRSQQIVPPAEDAPVPAPPRRQRPLVKTARLK